MCGILVRVYARSFTKSDKENFERDLQLLKKRGPDETKIVECSSCMLMGFTRLAINGLGKNGNGSQPFVHGQLLSVTNGEIYNHRDLRLTFSLSLSSLSCMGQSDCEVVPLLYSHQARMPQPWISHLIDGVYASAVYDGLKDALFVTRDPFGVRPLYYGLVDGNYFSFSSLVAATNPKECSVVKHFPPGFEGLFPIAEIQRWITQEALSFSFGSALQSHIDLSWLRADFPMTTTPNTQTPSDCANILYGIFKRAVLKRKMTERPFGCLLSGGLDSSSVVDVLAASMENPRHLRTFSIGFQGSPDLEAAEKVAKALGTHHKNVVISPREYLDALPEVIKSIETFCVTTVRASTFNYLLGKWIKENTDIVVVFNGDFSDEAMNGYAYNFYAPAYEDIIKDRYKRIQEIHYYDCLRSERCVSAHGLESRTPFADKEFVQFCLSLPASYTSWGKESDVFSIEKGLFRHAMAHNGSKLPKCILQRSKCALSNGTSMNERGKRLVDHINKHLSSMNNYSREETPLELEKMWYKRIFMQKFGDYAASGCFLSHWIPTYDRQGKCSDNKDPSAREL